MADFQYCLNASTIKTTPILQQIDVAAQAGYQAIELWHDDVDAHLALGGSMDELRDALDERDLVVPSTIYLGDWFDASQQQYPAVLQECRRRMMQAAQLGAEYVIAGPPAGRADYGLGARRYRELLEMGIELGVKPSMEFLGFVEQLNTIEDALEVMRSCGHPKATTVLDPFHIYRGGGSMQSITKLRKDQIAISHFNDAPDMPPRQAQHDSDRVMPGDGHLDLSGYVELLRKTGYRKFLSLELFREDLWAADPYDVARDGLEKMRHIVESY